GAVANPTEQLSRIEIFHIFDFTSTGPSNSFFVDDLTISAVPLPSTIFLLFAGLVAFVSRRELARE
ncbi:MAG: PEP-CTERM sorting domain-containing protein, partial [Pseudomonadota bacterium]